MASRRRRAARDARLQAGRRTARTASAPRTRARAGLPRGRDRGRVLAGAHPRARARVVRARPGVAGGGAVRRAEAADAADRVADAAVPGGSATRAGHVRDAPRARTGAVRGGGARARSCMSRSGGAPERGALAGRPFTRRRRQGRALARARGIGPGESHASDVDRLRPARALLRAGRAPRWRGDPLALRDMWSACGGDARGLRPAGQRGAARCGWSRKNVATGSDAGECRLDHARRRGTPRPVPCDEAGRPERRGEREVGTPGRTTFERRRNECSIEAVLADPRCRQAVIGRRFATRASAQAAPSHSLRADLPSRLAGCRRGTSVRRDRQGSTKTASSPTRTRSTDVGR